MQLVNSDMKNFEIAEVLRQVIQSGPVVPVIVIHDLAKALPLAQAGQTQLGQVLSRRDP